MLKKVWFAGLIVGLGILLGVGRGQPAYAQDKQVKNQLETKDLERVKKYSQNMERSNLKPVGVRNQNKQKNQNYTVQPVLFVASDQAEKPQDRKAIDETFQVLQSWYAGVLRQNNTGYAMRTEKAQVYKAPQNVAYYKCPNHEAECTNADGLWGNVQTEMQAAGYPLWQTGNIFIILVRGGGGWAGSGCGSNCLTSWPAPGPAADYGVAILGDWALDGITGTVNSDCEAALGAFCGKAAQQGVIGHELGHTLGLAHAMDKSGSIMNDWWNFPKVSLMSEPGNDEQAVLRDGSKYLTKFECSANGRVKDKGCRVPARW